MCKTVNIEYKCERCSKAIVVHKKPRFGITFTGRYPKEFTKVNKRPLCTECKKAHDKSFNTFMNELKPKAKGV